MASSLQNELEALRVALAEGNDIAKELNLYCAENRPWLLGEDDEPREIEESDAFRLLDNDERAADLKDTDVYADMNQHITTRIAVSRWYANATEALEKKAALEQKKKGLGLSVKNAEAGVDKAKRSIEDWRAQRKRDLQSDFDEKWKNARFGDTKASYSGGSIFKRLLLGLIVVGPIFASIMAAVMMAVGLSAGIGMTLVGVGYLVGIIAPVALYIKGEQGSASSANKDRDQRLAEKEQDEKQLRHDIEAVDTESNTALESKLQAAEKKLADTKAPIRQIDEEIVETQEVFRQAVEKASLRQFAEMEGRDFSDDEILDGKRVVEILSRVLKMCDETTEEKTQEFFAMMMARTKEVQVADHQAWMSDSKRLALTAKMDKAWDKIDEAAYIKSADATLSWDDMGNLDRIIEKISTGRAATLSEALTIIDAENAAEERHREQMGAMEEHNRRIEEAKEREAQERKIMEQARMAQERMEAERMQKLKQQEIAMQQEHNARMQEEERRRTAQNAEANEQMLRQQREKDKWERQAREREIQAQQATAQAQQEAAQAAAAQRDMAQAAAERAEQQAVDQAKANCKRCATCKHQPSCYNWLDAYKSNRRCDYAGMLCSESSACQRYVNDPYAKRPQ